MQSDHQRACMQSDHQHRIGAQSRGHACNPIISTASARGPYETDRHILAAAATPAWAGTWGRGGRRTSGMSTVPFGLMTLMKEETAVPTLRSEDGAV